MSTCLHSGGSVLPRRALSTVTKNRYRVRLLRARSLRNHCITALGSLAISSGSISPICSILRNLAFNRFAAASSDIHSAFVVLLFFGMS